MIVWSGKCVTENSKIKDGFISYNLLLAYSLPAKKKRLCLGERWLMNLHKKRVYACLSLEHIGYQMWQNIVASLESKGLFEMVDNCFKFQRVDN